MAKKSKTRTVKTVHTSNVGANEETKTLWVFGAGASRHLGFPLSFDLLSKSVGICTAKLKTFSGEGDVRYGQFRQHYLEAGKPVPTPETIAKFKDDPGLALEYIHVWDYLKPENTDFFPIQDLFRLWVDMQKQLRGIGINLTPQKLLTTYPEDLINRVRDVDRAALVRDKLAYDDARAKCKIAETQQALQQIYFYTLSRFNDDARETTHHSPLKALYTQFVRSFILDTNARIITFNYDTMLDEALFTHFTRSWKYGGMTIAGINGYPVATGSPADLVLIKPHGSLNYLICDNCNRAHVNWFWSYRQTGANKPSSGNRRCVHCTAPRPGRTELMSSLMVAPLYDKRIIKQSHNAISKALMWADHVVSVGYSFPAQDTYVYELMGKAINARTGAPLTISVVSHTPDSAKEIAKLLRSGLKNQKVKPDRVKVKAEKLKGFEEVKTGSANIPVKT